MPVIPKDVTEQVVFRAEQLQPSKRQQTQRMLCIRLHQRRVPVYRMQECTTNSSTLLCQLRADLQLDGHRTPALYNSPGSYRDTKSELTSPHQWRLPTFQKAAVLTDLFIFLSSQGRLRWKLLKLRKEGQVVRARRKHSTGSRRLAQMACFLRREALGIPEQNQGLSLDDRKGLIQRTKPWELDPLASVYNVPARVGRSVKSFQQAQNTAESRHTGKQGWGAGQKLHKGASYGWEEGDSGPSSKVCDL